MADRFADLLRRVVADYKPRTRRHKQDIAEALGYSPSMVSHLLAGRRPVKDREAVLKIAHVLDVREVPVINELLRSAGYLALSQDEVEGRLPKAQAFADSVARAAVGALAAPEHDLFYEAVNRNMLLAEQAWEHYVGMRDALYRREWSAVTSDVTHGVKTYYWPLRQEAARLLAHFKAVEATALHHQDDSDGAIAACFEGLRAAEVAEDPMAQCMLFVRLASIEKLRGRFNVARQHYQDATRVLDSWQAAGGHSAKQWCAHWRERVRRKEASLLLFQGRAKEALRELRQSQCYFAAHQYELSQVLYSLGWARNLLGDWDEALEHHKRGLEITYALNDARGDWLDYRSLLQGYLYIGGDYLQRHDYAQAEDNLHTALGFVRGQNGIPDSYHEVGRIYLLLGQCFIATDRLQSAWEIIDKGLRFYQGKHDPVRLANAYNIIGDWHLANGAPKQALEAYEHALISAQQSEPAALYYAIAARIKHCLALLRGQEDTEVIRTELKVAEESCLTNQYWQHLARLKVVEAELCLREHNAKEVSAAITEAFSAARRFNGYLVEEVNVQLEALPVDKKLLSAIVLEVTGVRSTRGSADASSSPRAT
ncbi:MAG TPA: helix-turn-helix domain-containing protein [Ktedonobacterales bacterium]|nr:helix-turn-helix domain-containing protein [Ktedonobacterales bacterium]